MKYVLAIDSFKGCLTSAEAEKAVANALAAKGHTVLSFPMSDGGDGMLSAFASAAGARIENMRAHDPLMRLVDCQYAISPDGTAIIETAQACGLCRLKPEERNPLVATTYGVGEIVAHAVLNGCKKFIIGLGGSGTSDAGVGMIRGLMDRLAKGGRFDEVFHDRLSDCAFVLASDVRNPLCGDNGAAAVFGSQKGADAKMIDVLDLRARRFAEVSARHFGVDKSSEPGAGAAGGLGYAFMEYMGATARPGADILLEMLNFESVIADADVVVTGEGRADRQTLMGKLPERVLRVAQKSGVPVWLVAGQVEDAEALRASGFARVECITPSGLDLAEAMRADVAARNLVAVFD